MESAFYQNSKLSKKLAEKKQFYMNEQFGNRKRPISLNASQEGEKVIGWEQKNSRKNREFEEADIFMNEQ